MCIAVATVLPVGCSDDNNNLGLQPVCVEFNPDTDPISGDVVARAGAGSTCDTAEIELVVTGVNNIYGASLTVEYDSAGFLYVSQDLVPQVDPDYDATEGSLLASDGASLIFVDEDPDPFDDRVTLVVTRTGTLEGIDASEGNDVLIRLRFIRLSTSDSDLDFVNATLQSPGDPSPEPIPDVEWFGGRLDVN